MKLINELTTACFNNNFELVKKYLSMGVDINGIDKNFDTPLSCAIQGYAKETMIYLLENGADPNKPCGSQQDAFPIVWVVDSELDQFYGTNEVGEDLIYMLDILLKYGSNINNINKKGKTVLDFVISYKNPKAVYILREKGAKTGEELQNND